MKIVGKVAWHTVQATLVVLIFAVALFIIVNALLALLPPDAAERVTTRARIAVGLAIYNPPELSEEGRNANTDHQVVSQWVQRCLGSPPRKEIPMEVQELLTGVPGFLDGTGERERAIAVHPLYIRVARLSHSLLDRRISLDGKLSGAYTVAQVGTFLTILIGLLTTVFVGLSSTEVGKQLNRVGLGIRLSALALPALGTAVAAVIAFYDPNGNLARQSQVAAGLQQLHSQLSHATWKMVCLKTQSDQVPQDMVTRLDSWTQRMQELIASAGDSRAQTAGTQSKSAGPKTP
ncbi:hypothetical protein [Massilia sp. BKSP1R2A-1]|uniref:hypothetical protein n=1 Tax=Massilia sp. BKSP1R2A-1 TaxID=3422595 RepID=UPI003D355E43